MKRLILLFFILSGGVIGFFLAKFYLEKNYKHDITSQKTIVKKNNKVNISSKSIFIPYWSLEENSGNLADYDTYIYFGIAAGWDGINQKDGGFLALEKFNSLFPENKTKLLTLRMIDENINDYILNNIGSQEKIISETLDIIEQNNFAGVVLDLEISYTLNKEIKGQINEFVQQFYSAANKNYRKFYVVIYGDAVYRGKPYDIFFIGRNSDGILIMAYDFHKSRGESGPNFPFDSGRKYQYDFKKMISDFTQNIPREKITVIFGMFGYDWLVDEKKRPIRQAEALSLNEIAKKFLAKCEFKDCVIREDPISKESEINYVISSTTPDEQNFYRIDYHIVWFEDNESAKIKTDFLRNEGIDKISFWAYGYF